MHSGRYYHERYCCENSYCENGIVTRGVIRVNQEVHIEVLCLGVLPLTPEYLLNFFYPIDCIAMRCLFISMS